MTMSNTANGATTATGLALEGGPAGKTVLYQLRPRAVPADVGHHPPGDVRRSRSEQLASVLASAQAEFDHLHNITRRAGYRIIFRDPSGLIINHPGNAQHDTHQPKIRGGLVPSAVRRIREYVEANIEFKIELVDLAAIANLSRCHFAHAFKQSLGCTPHRYVMSQRLERARQLLGESALPIAEIALATGFADQSHLSRSFRASFGMSPRAYRRSRG
jgi:transcriptional regulator GlxA family with amidase domain